MYSFDCFDEKARVNPLIRTEDLQKRYLRIIQAIYLSTASSALHIVQEIFVTLGRRKPPPFFIPMSTPIPSFIHVDLLLQLKHDANNNIHG